MFYIVFNFVGSIVNQRIYQTSIIENMYKVRKLRDENSAYGLCCMSKKTSKI